MRQRRGAWARIGITLLNLLAPGLGLLRLGRWKPAIGIYCAGLLFLIFMYGGPVVGFAMFAGLTLLAFAVYPISIVQTWVLSDTILQPRPWYARWYWVVGAMLLSFGINYALHDENRVRYRSFHTPAEGMAPTLSSGDRFFAYMSRPRDLRRGDVLLVRAPDGSTYVKRLAALPGDMVGMANGVVVLNGKPVAQHFASSETITDAAGTRTVRKLRERFPGEVAPHDLYDDGSSHGDNFGPELVRSDHIFLLGDNRDHSADSRYSQQDLGLEQVPLEKILGWPLFHSFGSSGPLGERINRDGMK